MISKQLLKKIKDFGEEYGIMIYDFNNPDMFDIEETIRDLDNLSCDADSLKRDLEEEYDL